MAGNLIPLEEAAAMLGKTADELTELRSRNEIFGIRSGSSWKFKMDEIHRYADEVGINVSSPGDDDDLSSDVDLIADSNADIPLDDIDGAIDLGSGSDINLSPSESHVLSGSDAEPGQSPSDTGKMIEGDDDLILAEDDLFGDDEEIGLQEDSDEIALDSDSELSSDFDDDSSLMLDDDSSEIALDAADSGVNLSPTDSGLSLDEAPLELGGSDIDALELPEDSDINLINPNESDSSSGLSLELPEESDLNLSEPGSGLDLELPEESGFDVAGGSGLDIELPEGSFDDGGAVQADNDFMLTPLEAEAEDESSGSQVIALEDSEIYADESSEIVSDSSQMAGALEVAPQAAAPVFEQDDPYSADTTITPGPASAAATAAPAMIVEQQIPVWMVAIQAICLMLLLVCGIVAVDLARNMFEFDSDAQLSSSITAQLLDMTGYFSK